ncbi:alpha/beta hydrolase [Ectothiorhodospiraceae bacterium BW-2]|nr:alpha/beta hydrolase [Ectothiorhodospiraceae bacterium BW-2]
MSDIYFDNLHLHHIYDGLEEDLCTGETIFVSGASGRIEVLTSCPDCYRGELPIVITCHPHPLHGGTMKNKVVHILAETFANMGLMSVTFNFRGVGRSQGRYDQGRGESEDLIAVCHYFQRRYPRTPLWLAGFSFGAYIVLKSYHQVGAKRLLLVAPPVTLFDFNTLPEIDVPWMVIQGGKDEVIEPIKVAEWVKQQPERPTLRWMSDADHFFHGRLNRVRDSLLKYWRPEAVENC